jgi:antitoxin ParD1/3/4
MPVRTSLNVSLTPELEKFVRDLVAKGYYHTASEAVREGLRLLELQERDREEAFKSLKARLRRAARAKEEDFIDGVAFFEERMRRLGKRAKKSA